MSGKIANSSLIELESPNESTVRGESARLSNGSEVTLKTPREHVST